MIFDTCMVNQELDMIECRLTELEDVPDLVHVLVEADVDHQGHPKPHRVTEAVAAGRFDRWKDRLHVHWATGLPTVDEHPDPWSREHGQREHTRQALEDLGARPDDLVLHGDIDEIPTATFVRNVRPQGVAIAGMRFHCFAVDWLHPEVWPGTVAARWGMIQDHVGSFAALRDCRTMAYQDPRKAIPRSGWHFSWVGGTAYTLDKLGSFCHPEIAARTLEGLERDLFMGHGFHVDGVKMKPVEVDRTWPKWIRDGHAPASWYRPQVEASDWTPPLR